MKLIDNPKRAVKFFSVQAMGGAVAILAAWAAMPADLKAALPAWTDNAVAIAVLVLGIFGRLVDQGPRE